MPQVTNLADIIEKQLPTELVSLIKQIGELAASRDVQAYLVGGIVRDLLLDKINLDIDFAVEGDATAFASELFKEKGGKIKIHKQFNTAKINLDKWSIDLVSTRQESYSRPGALPTIKLGSINDDLFRRDFTINAMAVALNQRTYGRLIDPYSGQKDLENRLIRVLHNKSFIDDSTRIWRGLRYEQRLDFQLEAVTMGQLKRDASMLDSISGDRIRYELDCILNEELPEKVLGRAWKLGILKRLSPSLKGDGWLAAKYAAARQMFLPHKPPLNLYMALLTYHLTDKEREQFISYLRLSKITTQTIRDGCSIRAKLEELADTELKPSSIYNLLSGYSPEAITVSIIASDLEESRYNMRLYLDKLRFIKPLLSGSDLIEMGIPQGPRVKEVLNKLLNARLDRIVNTKQDEEAVVRGWIKD
jgi:tRNA nucleotidyltransferase (CCA-adding enzyme)